ncbi:MAG: hypothetical protein SOY63_02935, partial [Alloprevotella sp.]|nr:hypothetical protein [Alloprevotella sp.]
MRKFYLLFALLIGISSATHAADFIPDPNKVYIMKNVANGYIPMFCVTQLKYSGSYVLGARNNKFDSRSFFVIEGNSTDGYTIRLREVTEENGTPGTTDRYASLKSGGTNNEDHTIRTKRVANTGDLTDNEKWIITETAEGSGKYTISSKALTTTNSWNIRGIEYTEDGITDKVKGVGTWNDNTQTTNQWYIYSIDEWEEKIIGKYGSIDEANYNKIGYPTQAYCEQLNALNANATTLKKTWSVETANAFGNAYNYLETCIPIPINMPVSGKAYTFKNVGKNSATAFYLKYVDASTGVTTTDNAAEATPFVCREVRSGVYAFVCNAGKYLAWKGAGSKEDQKGGNSNKGYVDAFDYEESTDITAANNVTTSTPFRDWAELTVEKLNPGSNVTGQVRDLRGFVAIKGRRVKTTTLNYYVIKSDGTYDQAGGTYFNDTYSSAFLIEDATYANVVSLKDAESLESGKNIATFSAPFPTVVPENTTAYSVETQTDSKVTEVSTYKVAEAGEAIPANTGVILMGTDTQVTMLPRTTETTVVIAEGALGNSAGAAKDITTENSYVLANKSGWAFYKVGDGATALPMNKAYLVLPANTTAYTVETQNAHNVTE